MKYLSVLFLLTLIGRSTSSEKAGSRDVDREQLFISNTASYFCVGNKNFLPCINPEVELESQSCREYVIRNSLTCPQSLIQLLPSNVRYF